MRSRAARLLSSTPCQVFCRLALAAIFLYAALPKIADPAVFADAIAAYKILPAFLIHPVALVLPWVEALSGLFLAVGLWWRGALWLIIGLLFFFITAAAFNVLRGLNIDCGCFGAGGRPEPALLVILRDLLFLLPALVILRFAGDHPQPEGFRRKDQ